MFGESDAMGMSIAISEAPDLAEQERIALQLAMEDEDEADNLLIDDDKANKSIVAHYNHA